MTMPVYRSGDLDGAQARLQAWRSRRPTGQHWNALEAILGYDEFFARARQPPFAHWLEGLRSTPSLHDIDRAIRAAARRDCQTLASWYPPPWDRALARLAGALELPLLAHLLRGAPAPGWMLEDSHLNAVALADPRDRFSVATGLHSPSVPADDVLRTWTERWLAALPQASATIRDGFGRLAGAVLAAADTVAARDALPDRLAALFRHYAGTPVAMACEFAALVLDLRRLRSGLVRRTLAQRAATVAA